MLTTLLFETADRGDAGGKPPLALGDARFSANLAASIRRLLRGDAAPTELVGEATSLFVSIESGTFVLIEPERKDFASSTALLLLSVALLGELIARERLGVSGKRFGLDAERGLDELNPFSFSLLGDFWFLDRTNAIAADTRSLDGTLGDEEEEPVVKMFFGDDDGIENESFRSSEGQSTLSPLEGDCEGVPSMIYGVLSGQGCTKS